MCSTSAIEPAREWAGISSARRSPGGGLRYGEGTIYYKDGTKERIYWQGPSVGFDFGANGSRSLVLALQLAMH